MDTKCWPKIEALFHEAVELPPDDRDAFLRKACAANPGIYKEVLSLLEEDLNVHSMLDGWALDAVDLQSEAIIGKQIGPYQITQEIGSGGMGAVYLAERTEGEFEQHVAMKLIKRGMDSNQILQRFKIERQILARLQHPNIARLLDGGLTDDGFPYFTLEYIEGEPIDSYCDNKKFSVEDRLRLFQSVCSAVQYAHQNLIVHRDLKPSNILVTEDGTVKLLDFGIAKVVTEESGATALTRTGSRVMTPRYAAPEQVRGEPVTTATDVYALGVILYELLARNSPYRLENSTPLDIEKAICYSQPKRPSTAITKRVSNRDSASSPKMVSQTRSTQPHRLRRQLAGDLDNICLMALRKEPERRYRSAEQFSEDISRYLNRLPVRARPDTFGYRTQKFVQRHKIAAVSTISVVLLIVILVAFYTARLARERDRAQLETQKAEQVTTFLTELFEVSDPSQSKGETVTARELLDRGADRIKKELSNQPEVQAAMMGVMGEVYYSLGLFADARGLHEQAVDIRRSLLGEDNPEVAESLNNLANVLEAQGDYDAAETLHRTSLALRRKLLGENHLEVAESLDDLAWDLFQKGNYDRAGTLYTEALVIRRKVLGEEHIDIAASLNNLAEVFHEKGEYNSAEVLYRQALAMNNKLLGEEHREVATNMSNLANLLRIVGKNEEAEPLHRQALALRQKLLGNDHPDVTSSLNSLAVLLYEKGDYEAAEPLFREALKLRRERLGEFHPRVAVPLTGLAVLLREKGDLEAAEAAFRESLELHKKTLPKGHPNIAHPLHWLGALLCDKDKPEEAEPLLREAVDLRRQGLPERHWRTAVAESDLGACLTSLSRFEEAEPLLINSQPIIHAKYGADSERTHKAVNRIIELYERWGRREKAEPYRKLLLSNPNQDKPNEN